MSLAVSEMEPIRIDPVLDTLKAVPSLDTLLDMASMLMSNPNSTVESLHTAMDRLYDEIEVHEYCATGISTEILIQVDDTIQALSARISSILRP